MIWSLFRIFKREILFVLFISFIINVLFLVSPWYMMQVADKVFIYRSMESLAFLTMILLWMFTVMGLLEFVRSRIMAAIAFRVEGVFYPKLYESLLIKSADGKVENPDQYFNELNGARTFISGEGMFGLFDLLWVPIYFVVLTLFSWKLAVFALLIVSISFAISYANHHFVHEDYEKAHELNFKANDEILSQLRSIEAIKSMGMYEGARERWFERHSASSTHYFKSNEQLSIWYSLSKNFRYVSMTLIMAASAYLVIENELTIGMMAATGLLLGRVIMPIDMLGNSLKHIAHIKHGLERLQELMSERRVFAKNKPILDVTKGLSVLDISVTAPDESHKQLLNHVQFEMPPASCLVVLGANGAGKTTLIRTLSGLLMPDSGSIHFGGVPLSRLSAAEIGYVSQDVRLLDGTIAENICRFGVQDNEKLIHAGQLVGIHDFVMTLKDGYHSVIGSDGLLMLSGGQRQLIALARAIYDQPAFIILDEPNSSLDEQGQQALLRVVQVLKQQGSTIIISTHQYSILPFSDYILTLAGGEVQLFESRQELIGRLQAGA